MEVRGGGPTKRHLFVSAPRFRLRLRAVWPFKVVTPESHSTMNDNHIPYMSDTPSQIDLPKSMKGVIGTSQLLIETFRIIDRVARTDCTVLITGESGTGKELVARAVHENSPRAGKALVTVNCGAIPEALLESELFGHARGAFTGAQSVRIGRIQAAEGGTLFLDEVGELPLSLQVKLLRVLQYKEYSPVGDGRVLNANIRVVAATNVDLEEAVREGKFREDLYYRLNVIHVKSPALKEREGDVRQLLAHFFDTATRRLGREDLTGITADAQAVLEEYEWPGNVRELENVLERAVLLSSGPEVGVRDLPERLLGRSRQSGNVNHALPDTGIDLRAAVESFENQLIQQALLRTGWNKKQAAGLLGINRTTLVEMLKRKGIERAA
jgi:transcriptional regulator with GAF, ATPase, and Fis domain